MSLKSNKTSHASLLSMDLQLRCISSHPRAVNVSAPIEFEFSSRCPRLVTAAGDLLIDQSTSTNASRSSIRTSARVEKVVYVGGSTTYLVFMENGSVASFAERLNTLRHVHEKSISRDGRSVTLSEGSRFGHFALFCKADSPSLWCIFVSESGVMADPFKLRSDIEGDQENINFVGGVYAKVRGKVATKSKSRACPIVAIATHPSLSLVSAAYMNGVIRVWDIARKEQRSHFDTQLLFGESIVDVAMHPTWPVIVACTTQGRIMSFYVKSVPFKRGDDPHLATSKTRDRKRRFRAMCFMPGSPAYLLLLTASRRILVRMIDKGGLIVNSSRFPKASRPLAANSTSVLASTRAAGFEDHALEFSQDSLRRAKLSCEPAFGLVATSLDNSGDIFVFQMKAGGLPGIRRPISSGMDTGFSHEQGNAVRGPVIVPIGSIVAYKGFLFSYQLGSEQATKLCQLPPGDVTKIEVARDEYGHCHAALVFFLGDDEVNQNYGYTENEESARYVLCTRRGDGESWTVSEPGEGRSGCFLNVSGNHDRIMILASSGAMISLLSFAGSGKGGMLKTRQSRGVRRIKFERKSATTVFRSPFATWSAVLYHDFYGKRLYVSRNAFGISTSPGAQQAASNAEEDFEMDEDTALSLQDREAVIEVRWQRLPSAHGKELYLGAVMTDRRIFFVRDVLQPLSIFEFRTVERIVVPFAPPSLSWVGPSVMVLFGNSLISVSVDGQADLIAGLSHGENVTALVAALPDRVVFARPSPKHAMNSLSIASRPYSAVSGLLRGMLALSKLGCLSVSSPIEEVQAILESHDVSQGSRGLMETLLQNDLAAIAYLLAVSEQGKFSVSPLRRAAFLGGMGDIRGALSIAKTEYSLLPGLESFHHGTDLYRLLQKILNMALACRDFSSARRCSQLLGRKGTFSSFVDVEGGFAAITAVVNHAKVQGNHELVNSLRFVVERSSKSSVATDSSLIPSQRELETIRRAIQSVNMSLIPLGRCDVSRTFVKLALEEDGSGSAMQGTPLKLQQAVAEDMNDRLEMWRRDVGIDLFSEGESRYDESMTYIGDSEIRDEDLGAFVDKNGGFKEDIKRIADSSDEEELFNTGRHEAADNKAESTDVVKREAGQLKERLRQQELESSGIIAKVQGQTRNLMEAQRVVETNGQTIAVVRARDMLERGIAKLDERRLSSAQRQFESALQVIQRGHAKGENAPAELIHELVYYRFLVQVKSAMEDIMSSEHVNTLAGRTTYMQLVSGLTLVPLRSKHRVEVLVEATDAYMMLNNFGSAARAMHEIKKIGVGDDLRPMLRDKYAACSARGLTDAMSQTVVRLCFDTLRVIGMGAAVLSCTVCPAKFIGSGRVGVGQICVCCGIGNVRMF